MLPENEPVKLTGAIRNVLTGDEDFHIVGEFVTPESRRAWGDFRAVGDALRRQEPLALVDAARQVPGARDVAYVWLIRLGSIGLITATQSVEIAFVFTWVWRPELGGWRLHAVGGAPEAPDRVPRTSPDVAPAIRSFLVS
ncbi:hypothetical protein GCM10023171_10610 [Microbacterium panaciterrae]|uniref:Nuclear transport factor 2 family protein n=1 Tax=Microbacterium panaciterrae TaxID=985759 RepID=A0ABP8P712_9MICO